MIPNVNQTIADGGLGILPATNDQTMAALGVCSLGVPNTIYAFGGTDPSAVTAALGTGPLVEFVAYCLTLGGGTIYAMPISQGTASSSGAVTKVGTGTAVVSLSSGVGFDGYTGIIKIVTGAANLAALAATYQLSLDGGLTYGPVTAYPLSGVIAIANTGLAISTVDGTFVAGDTYSWTTTAPSYTTTNFNTAITALLADPRSWKFAYLVGQATSATNSAIMGAAFATKLAGAEASKRYCYGVMESAVDTDTNQITAFASFTSSRVGVAAGMMAITSPVTGRVVSRSGGWAMAARMKSTKPKTDPGQFDLGPIPGIVSLARDEQATPGLDAQRFSTMRTIPTAPGYYITNVNMMAGAGSDYSLVTRRAVMDLACTISNLGNLKFLNKDIRVDAVTGFILEVDARNWESYVNTLLLTGLVGQVSASRIILNRANNILSSSTVYVKVRVTPLGYAKDIEVDIGYSNPSLSLV